ncbi:MAG TPA: autotransporter-associated beta strand repeat-containing protein, partial [bacterium]|nr:autotransporter-associated beta strand repeat-containing protein [bacterium]
MCKEFLVRSRVGRWFILMISFLLSSASLAQTNVTTNAGDQSAGSLGWAVTTLNNAGAGSISIDGGVGPITLTQPLASVSQSVTFQGANSSVVGQDNGQAQFNFQQGFALDTGAAMTLTNNGGNSLGLDSTMTAGTMTFSSGSNLSLDGGSGLSGAPAGSVFATFGASTAASGSQFDISGGLGFTSGSSNGGNAGSATVSILSLNLTGSNGVVAGGAGGDGPGGAGRGGDVSFSAGSVSLSGSGASLNLTGGNGGNLTGSLPGPSNGGNGGNVGVTVGFIEADSQADVTVRGGQGGDSFAGGNGPGGTGGSLLFNMGSVTLTSSSTMSLLGGDGGDSGGVAGASGGAGGGVNLLLNNLTLTGGSTFIAGGGTGGSGTGQGGTGGNTSFFVVNLSLDAGSLVEAYGGDAGAGGSATGGTVNSLIGDLEGAGTVSFGTGAIGLQINSGNFSGVLEGDEYLYKVYPGDLTLSGANSYTGGTTINGGTIFIDTGGSLGTGGIQANQGGTLDYLNNSIAGPNTITLVAGGGTLDFHNNSSAGNAVIDDGSYLTFADNSTAANASVTVENTGWAHFLGGAQGGNAHFTVNGILDISGSSSGITLGSLDGSGLVSLGGFNLGVGADGSSAIFSGVISDSGFAGGAGGSLTKLGTGTLALAGANNYSGGTSIIAGTLA